MKGVFDHFNLPVGQEIIKGEVRISSFEFKKEKDPLYNLRLIRDGERFMRMEAGKYLRLHIEGTLVMSDTLMEKTTNREFCYRAHGRVLIAGLGVGLIIYNILKKIQSHHVTEVVVIEQSQDVIDLVAPHYRIRNLKIIQGDIFNWKPSKEEKFNVIYFDIWPEISEDNLEQIKKLHNKFKWYLDRTDPEYWMSSWLVDFLRQRRRERTS